MRDANREVWRTGRKVGRTIYRQLGPEPSDDDPLIGVMDTREDAELVVALRKRATAPPWNEATGEGLISDKVPTRAMHEHAQRLAAERHWDRVDPAAPDANREAADVLAESFDLAEWFAGGSEKYPPVEKVWADAVIVARAYRALRERANTYEETLRAIEDLWRLADGTPEHSHHFWCEVGKLLDHRSFAREVRPA